LIEKLNKKPKPPHFCQIDNDPPEFLNNDYIYSLHRNNYYENYQDYIRSKCLKDNKHYYSYSKDFLTLSFPMVPAYKNTKYEEYVENKKKWISEKDFDRYKDKKEKIYLPKIQNYL